MTTEIVMLRGQGADNIKRAHSDAGGYAKREHAQVTISGVTLKSPSWWMGCKRDQNAARAIIASATTVEEIKAKGWL